MNKKVTFTELIDLLSQKNNCSKRDAEAFLRELISIVTDTVSEGNSLRINGLGVFKSQWVEDRASVNVRTGEPYLIPGHYKLTFTPGKEVREIINEPFACFTVEELPDDAPILSAPLEEEPDTPEEVETDEPEVVQIAIDVEQSAVEEKPDEIVEQHELIEEKPAIKEEQPAEEEQQPTEEEQQPVIEEEQPAEEEQQPAPRRWWVAVVAAVVVAVVGLFSFYLYRNFITIDAVVDKSNVVVLEIQEILGNDASSEAQVVVVDTMAVDTVVGQLSTPVVPEVVTDTIRRNIFLTTLSLRHYGHKAFWVYIYDANKHIIANPDNVDVGTVVVIPSPEEYDIDATDTLKVNKALEIAREIKEQRNK